jgi:hypothetical protein
VARSKLANHHHAVAAARAGVQFRAPKLDNLSDKAAKARMKQAKSIGMVVVVVEAVVSLSGTLSLWPHLVAILPGSMAIQQYITGLLRTCVIAASAGVAQTTPDGDFRGA